ncbi:MAG: DUF4136 domain-containing protein [Acidobacteria bacterium]|nr:DUF4136 domain-containing protein [Acidobacteriota bacterium]
MRSSRLVAVAGALALAAGAAACAGIRVNAYVQRGVDFADYRTYTWAPVEQLATGDPRLDNNEFFQASVQAAVEKALTARGLEKVQPGPPDLVVHYHASVTQQVDVGGADERYGSCDLCGPAVFDAGTLTLDLVDARTNRLVWRGWAERSIEGTIDNQQWLERQIGDSVARIFGKFPIGRL